MGGTGKNRAESGQCELAQKAVESKLKSDANVAQYSQMHDELAKQVETVREQVNLLKTKLEEARSRQAMLVARAQVAEARQGVAKAVGGINSSGAFSKMDKMEKKIMEEEAKADAQYEISGMDAERNDPFKQL